MNENNSPSKLFWYVPGAMLLLALLPWAYGFYTAVRLVVSVSAAIVAWQNHQKFTFNNWTFIFISVALIFNPIFPVYLSREVWIPIDIVVAILFFKHQKTFSSQ